MPTTKAALLTIPCELRNAIYMYIFDPDLSEQPRIVPTRPNELAAALKLHDASFYLNERDKLPARKLAVLQTCKQIHNEANLLALSMTPFIVEGECSYPDVFDLRSRPLSLTKLGAIRHIVLSARISNLRALNEAWCGLPFGHPSLQLDTLTVIPSRPECHSRAFAEIADLSQTHTLAYVFCETLKTLRKVKCVEIRNNGCFNEVVWRLFYRSLVYRLWRWGGSICGIKFESGELQPGGSAVKQNQWFKAYLSDSESRGTECGEEVCRLVGQTGEYPDQTTAGVGP
ncbi:hypothetical protein M409DRAFT_28210 [Zasmidium cellare ATCC 36951]|uniref:Uncharacterized protein n=1 Tax=Zasmidium cellare ATCC 36951 TaxID=1080233 RepID=A0A6A6C350_ZASCE|nr:uncharacterized protein M409DRAFT_28210 [Zasmidium cellare ATCC 36951]KAF2161481.1 hypothetical protein M409DRAFT_28210 [Zasmidium cellare ATCC 36951]